MRGELGHHEHQGKRYTGVWRDNPGPDAKKCMEVWTIGETGVDRLGELGSSATMDTDSLNSLHGQAQKRTRMDLAPIAGKPGAFKTRGGNGARRL